MPRPSSAPSIRPRPPGRPGRARADALGPAARAAAALVALALALAGIAPATAQRRDGGTPGGCEAIAGDRERLACLDRASDASGMPGAQAPAVPDAVTLDSRDTLRSMPVSLGERWELDAGTKQGRWVLQPYRPVYVLPVHLTDRRNRRPAADGIGNSIDSDLEARELESVFQLSLKAKLAETIGGSNVDLWAAYTQVSHWQVWTPTLSRPFRETNYEPELFAIRGMDVALPLGWRARMLGLGVNHQSNGRGEPLSRSWNRVIAQVGLERGDWAVLLRPWWRLSEAGGIDDNPGIEDYVGRAEAIVMRRMGANLVSVQLRHSLRGGAASRGSVLLDWAVPLSSYLKGHLRVFSGHGETLIDFNHRQTTVGFGISLAEWL